MVRASLVVQTSFIGDVILTTPLIAKLAETGDVDVVTTTVGAAVLANNPDIRRVIVYDKRRGTGTLGFVEAVLCAYRSGRGGRSAPLPRCGRIFGGGLSLLAEKWSPPPPPVPRPASSGMESGLTDGRGRRAYLAQGSLRSAALAMAAGYHERVGFAPSSGRVLYTRRVAYRDDWHHARRLFALADEDAAAGADTVMWRPRLYPGVNDVAAVDALLAGHTRPLVVVAPGSAWATKRWPGYGTLSRLLSADVDIAVVGGVGDLAVTREVVQSVDPQRVIDEAGKLSILGSAELLRRAAVVVTNDSAPQHLASAVGTPTVTLFGPTVPEFGFGPLAPGSRVLGNDAVACRPCDRHGPRQCPLGHWRCMRELSVEHVYQEVLDVMRVEG